MRPIIKHDIPQKTKKGDKKNEHENKDFFGCRGFGSIFGRIFVYLVGSHSKLQSQLGELGYHVVHLLFYRVDVTSNSSGKRFRLGGKIPWKDTNIF